VALVARQIEIGEVGRRAAGIRKGVAPVVVAQRREETQRARSASEGAGIPEDVIVVVPADVRVDRRGRSRFVVVVADRQYEIGVPALDERGDVSLRRSVRAVVADDGETDSLRRSGRRAGEEKRAEEKAADRGSGLQV